MADRAPPRSAIPAATADRGARGPILAAALLVALVVIAYIPALRADFIWDDDDYVQNNSLLRTPAGLWTIWSDPHALPQYYPLVHTSFWIEYHLWGLDPAGYHTVNILLHALAALLLWRVLVILWDQPFGAPFEAAGRMGDRPPGWSAGPRGPWTIAWFAAAVFALHPVQVESVAWITERKNVLAAVFYFAAALAYLHFDERRAPRRAGDSSSRRRAAPAYIAALVLFLAALLSKTVTCTLPVTLALVLWWRHARLRLAHLYPLLPFVALGAALGLHTAWLERTQVGAAGLAWALTPMQRVLLAGRAVWFYAGKLVWPYPLAFVYPRWQIAANDAAQYVAPLAVLAMILLLWVLRRRIGRGPLVATLCFLVALAPALGFFNVYPMR